jgi:hypothetical protein
MKGINKATIKRAARTAAPVLGGLVAAEAGAAAASRYVPGVAGFAARGTYHKAAVKLAAGALLTAATAAPLAKVAKVPTANLAAAMGAGVVVSAVAGPVMDAVNRGLQRLGLPPGGSYASDTGAMGGLLPPSFIDMAAGPGGVFADTGTMGGLIGATPGGVYPQTIQGIGTIGGLIV